MTMRNSSLNHVAMIMDGNRRWAEKRGLPSLEGHRAGAETVIRIIEACREFGIRYLTLYAFSTENWSRPRQEVDGLMLLLRRFLKMYLERMQAQNVRLLTIGRTSEIPMKTRKILIEAVKSTEGNMAGTVILALNYGGRMEIVDAARQLCRKAISGELNVDDLSEEMFRKELYLPEIPDPDLLIRTSGEMRISNFLLWQMSYSELWFTEKLWPDFDKDELGRAIDSYNLRERRFGKRLR